MEFPTAQEGHHASLQPKAHPNHPQSRQSISPEPYDKMDDVLLLGMAQINDDGLSPNSKKVIEKNTASFTASARVDTSRTTLSIQRPPSSGIDIAGFNYSRPARHSTQFSFRPPREKSSVDPSQKNNSKERRDSGVYLTSTDAE